MNPIVVQLLTGIVEILKLHSADIAMLKEEEGRETAEDVAGTEQLNELLARLTAGVPTMPPGIPPMPSDII